LYYHFAFLSPALEVQIFRVPAAKEPAHILPFGIGIVNIFFAFDVVHIFFAIKTEISGVVTMTNVVWLKVRVV